MGELENVIYDNISDELYRRGYGRERLGGLDLPGNEWIMLIAVAVALYLAWGR